MTVDDVLNTIKTFGPKLVVITGGEPLTQDFNSLISLVEVLNDCGFQVSIETNGTIQVPFEILAKSTIVMDYKLNFIDQMNPQNFLLLKPSDFIKFVVNNPIMMAMALNIQKRLYTQGCSAQFAYSPMISREAMSDIRLMVDEFREKSDLILKALKDTNMTGILNIQLHKLVGQQ